MTREEIVKETIQYYRTHRQAGDGNTCYYLMEDGSMCAVGRCMIEPSVGMRGTVSRLWDKNGLKIAFEDSLLQPQYHGHSADFWSELQALHDNCECCYWIPNEDGGQDLTSEGKTFCSEVLGVNI
jgi:hypothetical protein